MLKNNWYRQMLFSYFPIFLITVTILIFLSFIIVTDISHKETVKADRITTEYTIDRLSRSLVDIEMNLLEVVQKNNRFQQFLSVSQTEQDVEIIYDVADSLRTLAAGETLIDSVYLYRAEDETVLTQDGLFPLAFYSDRAFILQALENPAFDGWSELRDYQERSPNRVKQVLSMYKRQPLPFGNGGLVVINLDMYAIEQMIRTMNNNELSFLSIMDRHGEPIFSTHGASSFEKDEPDGRVLNRQQFDTLGWEFVSGSTAGQLFLWVSVISYVWIVIGIVTVLLAILYIIYITRKNYRPIRIMLNRIESIQMNRGEVGRKMDELSMIDRTLESLIEQSADFEKRQNESLQASRRQLFYDLIQGEPEAAEINTRMHRLKILPQDTKIVQSVFVVVEIAQYGHFRSDYSIRDQHTLKFALMNVIQELSQDRGMHGWPEWIGENRMGLILGFSEADADAKARVRSFVDTGGGWIQSNLRMTLRFGVGSFDQGMEGLQASYKAAMLALEHRLAMGEHSIIMSEELPGNSNKTWYKYMQLSAELVKAFRLLSGDWREAIDRLFEELRRDRLKDEEIRMILGTMMDMLSSELSEISEELQERFTPEVMQELNRQAETKDTLDQLNDLYLEQLTDIYRTYVAHSESKNHRAMITEIRAYIEENFENPDLSLKHLSDRFNISGKYASYLFKEEFNMKFVDFIVQLRMERAEHLLSETTDPIGTIALQVGYANAITFGRVFKRIIGVTPGDYRKLQMKPNSSR
ncbi:helix-turn-helix domain-containing protein [Paenibacillus daejeonensis]|uniref:helix-turn-helix domain-containing protein n=1 Tax=Paenibacillus daejeonensis TaxID=135193 RepID=UPI0003724A62|nr:helix-turn-helix domain-containing protein [Paenibacillus daejeonensis]